MTDAIRRLLTPTSIAVLGASRSAEGPSGFLLAALREYRYPGDLHLVNPGGHEIDGRTSLRSADELPEGIDLALVLVPAAAVVESVEQCAARGIGAAVIFSAGFGDDRDPAGPQREQALARIVERTGMRLLGPNAQGFLNLDALVPATFAPGILPAALGAAMGEGATPADARGNVAVLAQSGGLGYSLFARGLARGVRFSHVVSTGNEVDLEMQDFLEFLVDDPATDVVLMYLEGLKHPARFQRLARRARDNGTRLVIAKVGASAAGQRAALSHTGHVAGDDGAYDAVFRRYGVHRVHDPDEMLDVALALSSGKRADGRRAVVVSASGGSAVWLADALSSRNVELPELRGETRDRLEAMLPSFASVSNPVDISGGARVGPAEVLAAIADDPDVDTLVLATTLARARRIEEDRAMLEQIVASVDKPMVVYTYTEPSPLARDVLRELRLPLYTGIAGCADGVAALAAAGVARRPASDDDTIMTTPGIDEARRSIEHARDDTLCEYEVKEALAAIGITSPHEVLATNAREATTAARDIGGPVALKVQSPDVPHKARAGGVVLGAIGDDSVARGFEHVVMATRAAHPDARVAGVLVQQMAPSGLELLVGVQNRSGLGPIVVLGLGGELVEVLRRVVTYPAPFSPGTARRLLAGLGVGEIVRSLDDVAALVSAVSRFAHELQDIVAEVDLNPVIVERASGTPHDVDALLVRHPLE
jgi:acyl-CoA synthetase (NDP forming)